MTYDFSVLFKNEIVADVHINTDSNETAIKRYVSGPKQPFMCSRNDINYIYSFLESRCFENGRPDLHKILSAHGLKDNNPYLWCKKTHGVMFNDFWWIRFPNEPLTWEDVNVRR